MATQWRLTGDYFENCNCDVACPCLFSAGRAADLAAEPGRLRCRARVPYRQRELRRRLARRAERRAGGACAGADGRGQLVGRRLYRRTRRRPADRGARRDLHRRRGRPDGDLRAADRDASRGQEGADPLCDPGQEPLGRNPRHHEHGGRAGCRRCIRAARCGPTRGTRPRPTGSRWPRAARAAPSPITACAGTIPGATGITPRSAGRTRPCAATAARRGLLASPLAQRNLVLALLLAAAASCWAWLFLMPGWRDGRHGERGHRT